MRGDVSSLLCAIRFRLRYYSIEECVNKCVMPTYATDIPSQLSYFFLKQIISLEIIVGRGGEKQA